MSCVMCHVSCVVSCAVRSIPSKSKSESESKLQFRIILPWGDSMDRIQVIGVLRTPVYFPFEEYALGR